MLYDEQYNKKCICHLCKHSKERHLISDMGIEHKLFNCHRNPKPTEGMFLEDCNGFECYD